MIKSIDLKTNLKFGLTIDYIDSGTESIFINLWLDSSYSCYSKMLLSRKMTTTQTGSGERCEKRRIPTRNSDDPRETLKSNFT